MQKQPERDGFKGKQFLTNPPKLGRTLDTFFGMDGDKKLLYIAEVSCHFLSALWCTTAPVLQKPLQATVQGLPYVDREKFQDTQPNKPGKGFLTSDYSRSGEFTNTIRTEQYRTQLKQEEKIAKKQQAQLGQEVDILLAAMQRIDREPEGFLYDRVSAFHILLLLSTAQSAANVIASTGRRRYLMHHQQKLMHTSWPETPAILSC